MNLFNQQKEAQPADDFHYWRKQAECYDSATEFIIGRKGQNDSKEWLKKQFNQSDDVLEFGCGTGIFSEVIAGQVKQLVVTDMAQEMLSIAQTRLAVYPNVEVKQADVLHSDFDERCFDVVFLGNLLHVVNEPEQVLLSCKHLLKPGGRLLLIDYSNDGLSLLQKVIMGLRYIRKFGAPPKSNKSYRLADFLSMVQQAGFVVKDSRRFIHKASVFCVNAVR